ncbi:MAG: hypothetical protein FWD81_01335 [Methanomassiliicoccaceae archaeon]|nr:hypothetical protein [Methanomassiliicoccaceae archaeon]
MKSNTMLVLSLILLMSMAILIVVTADPQDGPDGEPMIKYEPLYGIPPEPLDTDLELRIKQDFFNLYTADVPEMTMDDVEIYAYYGTYNGCIVLDIGSSLLVRIAAVSQQIDDLAIPAMAIVWEDGSFHNIREAYYELDLLTYDDLQKFAFGRYY